MSFNQWELLKKDLSNVASLNNIHHNQESDMVFFNNQFFKFHQTFYILCPKINLLLLAAIYHKR
jgi:hypothetical protein